MTESFPRQQARTRRFTLGLPRSCQISPAGDRVAFLRSRGGGDPVNCLWVLDVATGAERLAADPAALGGGMAQTAQEKGRRERVREQATGIVSFASVSAESQANATMPAACSRTRSRRAFSCSVRAVPPPSAAGSATRRSAPVPTSSTHRQFTGSSPPLLRRNATRSPAGVIWNERGRPRVKRRVLACWRGKLSVMAAHLASSYRGVP